MTGNVIPPNAPDVATAGNETQIRREELEFQVLEFGAKIFALQHREQHQNYLIKWVAVVAGVVVILFMATIMMHMLHKIHWGPFQLASPAFSVAMIVAPIASITAITVALFIGAFKRFDAKDLDTVTSGAAGAFNTLRP